MLGRPLTLLGLLALGLLAAVALDAVVLGLRRLLRRPPTGTLDRRRLALAVLGLKRQPLHCLHRISELGVLLVSELSGHGRDHECLTDLGRHVLHVVRPQRLHAATLELDDVLDLSHRVAELVALLGRQPLLEGRDHESLTDLGGDALDQLEMTERHVTRDLQLVVVDHDQRPPTTAPATGLELLDDVGLTDVLDQRGVALQGLGADLHQLGGADLTLQGEGRELDGRDGGTHKSTSFFRLPKLGVGWNPRSTVV